MSSAAAALRYWERRQEISANNLANVSTDGFKGQRAFARLVDGALPTVDTVTDFRPGTLRPTGNPYDVTVEGRNFLVVQTPAGERLTRGGSFQLDAKGTLVDSAGNAVLGDRGPIHITANAKGEIGELSIGKSGVVRVNGAEVARLRVETIAPDAALQREGTGLFIPPAQRNTVATENANVLQGTLEDSNVNAIDQMVDMISIQRAFAAVQKAMTTMDAARGIAVGELGRPIN